MAGAAVEPPEAPVRHVLRHAAKLLQVVGTAGVAHALEHRDQTHAYHGDHEGVDAFAFDGPRQQRLPDIDQQQHQQHAGQHAATFVEEVAREPDIAPGKAAGIADQTDADQIEAAGVPGQQEQQPGQGNAHIEAQQRLVHHGARC